MHGWSPIPIPTLSSTSWIVIVHPRLDLVGIFLSQHRPCELAWNMMSCPTRKEVSYLPKVELKCISFEVDPIAKYLRVHVVYGINILLLETQPYLTEELPSHEINFRNRPFLTGEPLSYFQYSLDARHNFHEVFTAFLLVSLG